MESTMNAAIMILQYEHGVIRQVTDVLDAILQRSDLGGNHEHLMQIQAFLWNYVDHFHHQKEERFIFSEAQGISDTLAKDTKSLKGDHEKARDILKRMDENLTAEIFNERQDVFQEAASEFVKHITDHIQYEENVFFPGFEKQLAPEKRGPITQQFKDFLEKEFGGDAFYTENERFSFKIQNEILGPGYYDKNRDK
jgi:hemerythrin-like domain-containing protein